jgi:hypothetical protein
LLFFLKGLYYEIFLVSVMGSASGMQKKDLVAYTYIRF